MTTVTITDETHRKLKKLKKKKDIQSFDQLLDEIADEKLQAPESMFGEVKGLKEGEIREHKDRADRYD
jgi:predicted CopG family antitoxin